MAYTGNVEVGSPPDTRELSNLTISKVSVGPMDNNAYLLRCTNTGESLLVDAANDAQTLLDLVKDNGGNRLDTIATTHAHHDHWQALGDVVAATGATTAAGREDASGLPVAVDVVLDDGDELWVGDCRLAVIALRGHTPGSVALYYDAEGGHLFTGDSLFPGGPGKTTNPKDFTSLMDDLQQRVFDRLPDSVWVYPGHGNDTTLGTERPSLSQWRERGW